MIGSKFSHHFFNQSQMKPKPIVARAFTFFRALCQRCVITSSFDWITGLSPPFFWLVKVISLVLVLRHSVENRSLAKRSRCSLKEMHAESWLAAILQPGWVSGFSSPWPPTPQEGLILRLQAGWLAPWSMDMRNSSWNKHKSKYKFRYI